MARAKRITLNLLSFLLIGAGLALLTTIFWSPFAGGSDKNSSASSEPGPGQFNVPVLQEATQKAPQPPPEPEPEKPEVAVPEDKTLEVTIPAMSRVQSSTIPTAAGDDEEQLKDHAAIHLKGTGFPWEEEANVYLAGHRLGYPGTGSLLAFYDLPDLSEGDEIFLTDSMGREYTYRVFKQFVVDPTDMHITQPIPGKNIVTLQTCTLPDYSQRVIVQAEKVA